MKIKFIILLAISTSVYSQEKIDRLTLTNSVNQVYGILKFDSTQVEYEESEGSEFLSDFFWHLKSFSKNQGLPVKFFECNSVIYNDKQINFPENRSSMIIFIRKNSSEYLKLILY